MRSRIFPLVVSAFVLLGMPLLAQESAPPTTSLAETGQSVDQAGPIQVIGTVTILADDHIAINVERVLTASSEAGSALEGQDVAFTLDATTEKPAGLQVADRVQLTFTESEGKRLASRIVLATLPGEPVIASAEPSVSEAPAVPAEQPEAAPPAEGSVQAASAPQPKAPEAAAPADGSTKTITAPQPKQAGDTERTPARLEPAAAPSQQAAAPQVPAGPATVGDTEGQDGPAATTTSQPDAASSAAEEAAALNDALAPGGVLAPDDTLAPEQPASDIQIDVPAPPGSEWQLVAAIGVAALLAVVVLGLTRRKEPALVGLGLAQNTRRR